MDLLIAPKIQEVTEVVDFLPAVSIIMPFDPKMRSKATLNDALKRATCKVEWELHENYGGDIAGLVVEKLKVILSRLNFNAHTISIAIYVSPVFETVLYLNIPVEEKVVVDESFEIRDLVYIKKELRKYILLLLSDKECSIYLGHSESLGHSEGLVKILSNTSQSAYSYRNKTSIGFGNHSEIPRQSELVVEYLRYNDNVLDITLNAYPRPLFVLGNEKVMEHFKNLSKHTSAVIEYVQCNYEEANLKQLKEIMKPYLANWQKVKQKYLSNQLKDAARKNKLAFGIDNVWCETISQRGRLLIVEKNYAYNSENTYVSNVISKPVKKYDKFSCIKNPLDDVIEKVLRYGGDVEFVDKDVLRCYDHIALIK